MLVVQSFRWLVSLSVSESWLLEDVSPLAKRLVHLGETVKTYTRGRSESLFSFLSEMRKPFGRKTGAEALKT